MTFVLRDYQQAAVDAMFDWVSRYEGHPLLVVPTGGGKTPIMGAIIRRVLDNAPSARVLVLAHRKELLQQNMKAVLRSIPATMVGVYSAGLKTKNTTSPVIIAGIQSAARNPYKLGAFDLILVDESHLVPTDDDTMYRKFLKAMRTMNPQVRLCGLTATPYRLTTGLLHRGKNPVFTDIAYEASVKDLVAQGYLCPLISKATLATMDTSGVAMRGGDFVAGALERAVDKDDVTAAIVDEMVRLFADRNKWLVFCSGVAHAEHVAEALTRAGVAASVVHGSLDADTRAERLAAFKAGRLRALTSMDVLTTGYDEPAIDAIALLRPTKSTGLYVQMVGRGFRLHPSKQNTLVLDFADNVEYHGPVDAITVDDASSARRDGTAPTKVCPHCQEIVYLGARICPACQAAFPEPEKPPLLPEASSRPIMSTEPEPIEWHDVAEVYYSRHEKEGKLPSLRVDYWGGYKIIASEWICFEHTGFARHKAEQWWARRSIDPPPATVNEAMLSIEALPSPSKVAVQRDGRWFRVVETDLTPVEKPAPSAFTGRACWTCKHYSSDKCCRKWNAEPPADVAAVGCDAWEEFDDDDLPF